jgi:hypothetical protein
VFSNTETLKELARQDFNPGLAETISKQIDAAAQSEAARLPSATTRGEVLPESIATLFLADRFYNRLGVGKFHGRLTVTWNGMDSFIFTPSREHPFTFTTSTDRVIQPRLMETDGGSIPRILRGLKQFSSWGYAPAFIIHDWLFVAKKCQHQPDTDWSFTQSAEVMAEAMKTLMEVGYTDFDNKIQKLGKAEDTLYLMYQTVNSFIAEDLWEDDSSVHCIV